MWPIEKIRKEYFWYEEPGAEVWAGLSVTSHFGNISTPSDSFFQFITDKRLNDKDYLTFKEIPCERDTEFNTVLDREFDLILKKFYFCGYFYSTPMFRERTSESSYFFGKLPITLPKGNSLESVDFIRDSLLEYQYINDVEEMLSRIFFDFTLRESVIRVKEIVSDYVEIQEM